MFFFLVNEGHSDSRYIYIWKYIWYICVNIKYEYYFFCIALISRENNLVTKLVTNHAIEVLATLMAMASSVTSCRRNLRVFLGHSRDGRMGVCKRTKNTLKNPRTVQWFFEKNFQLFCLFGESLWSLPWIPFRSMDSYNFTTFLKWTTNTTTPENWRFGIPQQWYGPWKKVTFPLNKNSNFLDIHC